MSSAVTPENRSSLSALEVDELYPHLAQPRVNARVVYDLVGKKYSSIRELPAGLVSEVQRKINTVTEAELFGQSKSEPPHRERVALAFDLLDQTL